MEKDVCPPLDTSMTRWRGAHATSAGRVFGREAWLERLWNVAGRFVQVLVVPCDGSDAETRPEWLHDGFLARPRMRTVAGSSSRPCPCVVPFLVPTWQPRGSSRAHGMRRHLRHAPAAAEAAEAACTCDGPAANLDLRFAYFRCTHLFRQLHPPFWGATDIRGTGRDEQMHSARGATCGLFPTHPPFRGVASREAGGGFQTRGRVAVGVGDGQPQVRHACGIVSHVPLAAAFLQASWDGGADQTHGTWTWWTRSPRPRHRMHTRPPPTRPPWTWVCAGPQDRSTWTLSRWTSSDPSSSSDEDVPPLPLHPLRRSPTPSGVLFLPIKHPFPSFRTRVFIGLPFPV